MSSTLCAVNLPGKKDLFTFPAGNVVLSAPYDQNHDQKSPTTTSCRFCVRRFLTRLCFGLADFMTGQGFGKKHVCFSVC